MSILLYGCKEDSHETSYEYSITLNGDYESEFSNLGESRKYSLSILKKTLTDGIPNGEEQVLSPSVISRIKTEGGKFVSTGTDDSDIYSFEMCFEENKEDELCTSYIYFSIVDGGNTYSKNFVFTQAASDIYYKYHIYDLPEIKHIPEEGGTFEVPFTCYREKYVNGKPSTARLCSLEGLRYLIYCGNSAMIHSADIVKDGTKKGFYKIIINSKGRYHLEFLRKYESNVFVQISNDETEEILATMTIIQPQTDDDEYFYIPSTLYSTGRFEY